MSIADKLLYLDETKTALKTAINRIGGQLVAGSAFRSYADQINSLFWEPDLLFANGEQGAWYDPSDLSTLFQDAAGTTPVMAAGDPVGLMLDKSKGLVLGPEALTNGDFSDGGAGWAVNGPDSTHYVTFNGEGARYFSGATSPILQLVQPLPPNKLYEVTVVVSSHTSGSLKVDLGGVPNALILTGAGTFSGLALPSSELMVIYRNSPNVDMTISNISVRELPGNHATQTVSAARPTYQTDGAKSWLSFDGIDDRLVSAGSLRIDRAQSWWACASISAVSGTFGRIVSIPSTSGAAMQILTQVDGYRGNLQPADRFISHGVRGSVAGVIEEITFGRDSGVYVTRLEGAAVASSHTPETLFTTETPELAIGARTPDGSNPSKVLFGGLLVVQRAGGYEQYENYRKVVRGLIA